MDNDIRIFKIEQPVAVSVLRSLSEADYQALASQLLANINRLAYRQLEEIRRG